MSKIIIIDTTINSCYVALTNEEKILSHRVHQDTKTQAAFINQAIESMMEEQNCTFSDVDAIASCMGPGSYTGLRIGLSTAKGLCYALDIPLIGFNRMELIGHEDHRIVLIKARVGEYFLAHYKNGEVLQSPVHKTEDAVSDYLCQMTDFKLIIIGEENSFEHYQPQYLPEDFLYNKEDVTLLVNNMYSLKEFEDVAYVEPMYLKSVYTTVAKKKSL